MGCLKRGSSWLVLLVTGLRTVSAARYGRIQCPGGLCFFGLDGRVLK